jgi:hypothetical protein
MNAKLIDSPKTYLLIVSIFLLFLIIIWPIYFFGFSSVNLIELGINELISFTIFEVILIICLIIFWEFYRRFFKN